MTQADLSRAVWCKSRRSQQNGACIEVVRNLPGIVVVRDSKHRDGAVLTFTAHEWRSFISGIKHDR